jgi:hypothetical protein
MGSVYPEGKPRLWGFLNDCHFYNVYIYRRGNIVTTCTSGTPGTPASCKEKYEPESGPDFDSYSGDLGTYEPTEITIERIKTKWNDLLATMNAGGEDFPDWDWITSRDYNPYAPWWLFWNSSRYVSGQCKQSVSIQRVKWRIAHPPSVSLYVKVWIQTRFVPYGSSIGAEDNVLTDINNYVWEGIPADTTKSINSPENKVTGEYHILEPPNENGNVWLEIKKYSFLRDYEPDISDPNNPQSNGYPDPEWEAAAP